MGTTAQHRRVTAAYVFSKGATPRELVLEACRRNNSELLEQVIVDIKQSAPGRTSVEKKVADVLNNAQDAIGNGALHLAALNGCCSSFRNSIMMDLQGDV